MKGRARALPPIPHSQKVWCWCFLIVDQPDRCSAWYRISTLCTMHDTLPTPMLAQTQPRPPSQSERSWIGVVMSLLFLVKSHLFNSSRRHQYQWCHSHRENVRSTSQPSLTLVPHDGSCLVSCEKSDGSCLCLVRKKYLLYNILDNVYVYAQV